MVRSIALTSLLLLGWGDSSTTGGAGGAGGATVEISATATVTYQP